MYISPYCQSVSRLAGGNRKNNYSFERTKLDRVFRHTVSLSISKIKSGRVDVFFLRWFFSLIKSIYRVTHCFVRCICVWVWGHTRDTHIYIFLNFQFSIFPLSQISPKRKSYDPKRRVRERERCLHVCVCVPPFYDSQFSSRGRAPVTYTRPTSESFVTS